MGTADDRQELDDFGEAGRGAMSSGSGQRDEDEGDLAFHASQYVPAALLSATSAIVAMIKQVITGVLIRGPKLWGKGCVRVISVGFIVQSSSLATQRNM